MALALALALANHPDGFSPPLGETGRGLLRFTLHTSRFTFLKKNGFCGELGEKKCLPLPMNRVIFFLNHG